MDLVNKVKATISRYSMLKGQERVLIGLSGGPDSVCLLSVLNRLRQEFRLDLHAVYIDHGLRPAEVAEEIGFCRDLCKGLDIPFAVTSIDVKSYTKEHGLNKQEAARELRYKTFADTAYMMQADRVAVAHNRNDQAETLLIRLFRGAGMRGLAGIPPVRGNIIRPLIDAAREEIREYLDAEKAGFVVDSSNLQQDYLRNKIRLSLMPLIKAFNPNIIASLSRVAEILREEDAYLEIIVTGTLMKLISRKTESRIELFLSPMEHMHRVLLRRILRRAVSETKGLRGISFTHTEDMLDMIKNGTSGDRIYLPGGIRAIKHYSTFVITSEPPVRLDAYTLAVPSRLVLSKAGLVIEAEETEVAGACGDGKMQAVFDRDKVRLPLHVRARRQGDFFYPLGFGRRKKLQDFFVDEKVPRDERDSVPLVASGEDIIWVAGYRADDRFKTDEKTRRAVRLELKPSRL